MGFDIDQLRALFLFGHALDVAFALLVTLGVAAWFVLRTTRHPLARRVLRLVLFGALLFGVAVFAALVALLAYSGRGGTAVALLLMPLGVVFGLGRARRRWAHMAATGTGLGRALVQLVPFPLFVAAALYFVLAELSLRGHEPFPFPYEILGAERQGTGFAPRIGAGSGVVDSGFGVLRFVGYGALYVFFLSIPYVMGSLSAAALLLLARVGWDRPLRPRAETDGALPSRGTE